MDVFEEEPEGPEFDRDRFREAILYVCSLPEELRDISETKLHKILFYADRKAHFELGHPITGARYIRHEFGPFAEPLRDTLQELEDEKAIVIHEFDNSGVELNPDVQRCPQVFRGAETDLFSEDELKILTGIARDLLPHSSEAVSDKSHDIVWESVEPYEEIPYYLSYLQVTEKDDRDEVMEWARQKAEEVQDQ